jgi:hypothetical protein
MENVLYGTITEILLLMIRTDLFTAIHKAIRAQLFDAGLRMQNLDIHNDEDVAEFTAIIRDRLAFLHEHADKEDTYIFPVIAGYDRELVEAVEREHETAASPDRSGGRPTAVSRRCIGKQRETIFSPRSAEASFNSSRDISRT